MCNMQASIKHIFELEKQNFKSKYSSMQNMTYLLEYMKLYFQENETHECGENRFHEVKSSSLLNITFVMRENLCNARDKSKIRMHMI